MNEKASDPEQLPAGWYLDLRDPSIERYWLGKGWTERTRPVQPVLDRRVHAAAIGSSDDALGTSGVLLRPGAPIELMALSKPSLDFPFGRLPSHRMGLNQLVVGGGLSDRVTELADQQSLGVLQEGSRLMQPQLGTADPCSFASAADGRRRDFEPNRTFLVVAFGQLAQRAAAGSGKIDIAPAGWSQGITEPDPAVQQRQIHLRQQLVLRRRARTGTCQLSCCGTSRALRQTVAREH